MFSDWFAYFWGQIENLGQIEQGMYNLPWMYVVLQPLRLIGPIPAVILVELVSLFVIIKLCLDLKLSRLHIIMIIFSASVLWNFFMGQIDGLIISAYMLPPTFAVLLTLFKPHTCLWAGWDGIKKRPVLIWMAVILVVLAFLIWRWPFAVTNPVENYNIRLSWVPTILAIRWNWSFWPWGILLIPFILRGRKITGMLLSPFIFPYTGLQSLIGLIIAVAGKAPFWLFLLVWVLLWVRWDWMLSYF